MKRVKASDKLIKLRKSLSPEELEKVLENPTSNGTKFFRDLVEEKRKEGLELRKSRAAARQIDLAKEFYSDLVRDGHLKVDTGLFSQSSLVSMYQTAQSHEGVAEHFEKVESKNLHESVLAMVQIYRVNYENIFREFLRPLADLVKGRATESNGDALVVLNNYRDGRHQELFRSLNSQVRNSIDHADYLLDDKRQLITFRDRNKPEMTVTYGAFRGMFMESFMLKLSISTAAFELVDPIVEDALQSQEMVVRFIKKHRAKLVPKEGGPSIYEIGRFLRAREGKS